MKLKPCPFCGGEAQVNERYRSGTPNRKMYWISCKACGISQQNTNVSGYRYQSKAIDRWNRRKPIDKIVEQLEELKKRHFLTMANTGDDKLDLAYEYVGNALDTAIEIVKGGQNE